MLKHMRKGSQNIFVKGFLGILAISFVVWGVGDVFRGRSSDKHVATIDGKGISYAEFDNYLKRELSKYQQILGKPLTEEQIAQYGIKNRVINQIIDNKIIRVRLSDLKFQMGDEVAIGQIASDSMFFDESGKFSKDVFSHILQANGLNRNDFIDAIKTDSAVRLFIDTIGTRPASMKMQAKALYEYKNEQRVADLLVVPANYPVQVPEPSDTDLTQYYQENSAKFAVPELREVTYFTFGLKNIQSALTVTDEELNAAYQSNIGNYTESEKRDIEQYLFNSEDEAATAMADLKSGKAEKYAAKKTDLNAIDKDSLPAQMQDVVFALNKGDYSDVVKSELGFHIFHVKNIIQGHARPFAEVKNAVAEEIKETKASAKFAEYTTQIEDAFASGMKVEDVAKKFNLTVSTIPAIDEAGRGSDGKTIENTPEKQTFLPLVFSTAAGAVSPLSLLSDGGNYVALRVDNITAGREKALDEVRGIAIAMWKEHAREVKLKEFADSVTKKLQDGEAADKLAASLGLKLKAQKLVSRPAKDLEEGDKEVPQELALELFKLKENGATQPQKTENGELVIGQLKQIKAAVPDEAKLNNMASNLKEDFANDVLSQYNLFLRKKYDVKINKELLSATN
jgi:peptidyl-prolyl cis-trans isomerase D